MFDQKCLDLAEYFAPEQTPEVQAELAERIQDSIEIFLGADVALSQTGVKIETVE